MIVRTDLYIYYMMLEYNQNSKFFIIKMSKIPLYGTTHVKVRAPSLSILMKKKCNLGRILDGLLDLLSRGQYKGARNSFSGLKYATIWVYF